MYVTGTPEAPDIANESEYLNFRVIVGGKTGIQGSKILVAVGAALLSRPEVMSLLLERFALCLKFFVDLLFVRMVVSSRTRSPRIMYNLSKNF